MVQNFSVRCLCPGGRATEFLTTNDQQIKMFLSVLQTAQEVARIGLRAAGNSMRFVTPGFFKKIQAFVPRLFPKSHHLRLALLDMKLAMEEQAGLPFADYSCDTINQCLKNPFCLLN
jgi:short-subunit dehydrogenase